MLKSPRFLYPECGRCRSSTPSPPGWPSCCGTRRPTRNCSTAAAAGKLASREEVAKQAERMLNDPRAKAKVREFLLTWLKVDQPKT